MVWRNVEELYKKLENSEPISVAELLEKHAAIEVLEFFCLCGRRLVIGRTTDEYTLLRCNYCNKSKRSRHFKNSLESTMNTIKLLRFLVLFTLNLDNSSISEILELSKKTVNDLVINIQLKLSEYAKTLNPVIGGPGSIVQLDERFIGKRKYNVGRSGDLKIIFGGIDVSSKKFFTCIVPNRTLQVIGELIFSHVAAGSTVYTDQFSTYLSFLAIRLIMLMIMSITVSISLIQ